MVKGDVFICTSSPNALHVVPISMTTPYPGEAFASITNEFLINTANPLFCFHPLNPPAEFGTVEYTLLKIFLFTLANLILVFLCVFLTLNAAYFLLLPSKIDHQNTLFLIFYNYYTINQKG